MEIKPIEAFREASAPPAHYYPAPVDRSRKAIFYANLYKPETRPLYANAAIGTPACTFSPFTAKLFRCVRHTPETGMHDSRR